MTNRNMEQTAKKTSDMFLKTRTLTHYSMNIDEFTRLLDMCQGGKIVDAICIAFNYGFALGTRAHEKQRTPAL